MSGVMATVAHRERLRMRTTVTITRGTAGGPVFNPNTGTYDYPTAPEVYAGRAHVRPTGATPRVVEAGGQAVSLKTYDVVLPEGSDAAEDDTLTVTASPDAALVNTELRVLDAPGDDRQGNRRLTAVEAA